MEEIQAHNGEDKNWDSEGEERENQQDIDFDSVGRPSKEESKKTIGKDNSKLHYNDQQSQEK